MPLELVLAEKLEPSPSGKLIGHRIGKSEHLQLIDVIEKGGFATVYLAEDDHGAKLAVKVIESGSSDTDLLRFEQEFAKLDALFATEPAAANGIIRCFESGDELIDGQSYPWYSMEYAPRGDLRAGLEARRAALDGRTAWQMRFASTGDRRVSRRGVCRRDAPSAPHHPPRRQTQ